MSGVKGGPVTERRHREPLMEAYLKLHRDSTLFAIAMYIVGCVLGYLMGRAD